MQFLHKLLRTLFVLNYGGLLTTGQLFNKLKELSHTPGNIENLRELIKTFTHDLPDKADKNQILLYSQLGEFHPYYQSVKLPPNLGQPLKQVVPSVLPTPDIPDEYKNIKIFKYLQKLSFCPLGQKWIDLGDYLWPRYFKFTHCIRRKCSYPDGMVCQSANKVEPKRVPLLYWTCLPRVKKSRTKCGSWGKIYVSVVDECECAGCGGKS